MLLWQVVLGRLGRPQLSALLQEMLVTMGHFGGGVSGGFPGTPSAHMCRPHGHRQADSRRQGSRLACVQRSPNFSANFELYSPQQLTTV